MQSQKMILFLIRNRPAFLMLSAKRRPVEFEDRGKRYKLITRYSRGEPLILKRRINKK